MVGTAHLGGCVCVCVWMLADVPAEPVTRETVPPFTESKHHAPRENQVAPVTAMAQHDTSTPLPDTNDGVRIAYANQPERNVGFVDNVVITSQYTAWNFVPLFLFHQFSRFANFYFLVVFVLQMVPAITITNGIPYSLAPLSFVLFFDAIVTAQEDYNRHKADDHDNGKPCSAVRDGSVQRVAWRDLRVGDMVKVQRGQVLPADIVFLCAVSDDGEASDVCYVQTAQLDGETNLKLRSTLQVCSPYRGARSPMLTTHIACRLLP